jgi:threonine/homoserine/homoserine lactone efflux protein
MVGKRLERIGPLHAWKLDMTEGLSFIFAAALLLSAPGPTNMLLATSGAISGWRDAIPLLTAECLGYLISIGVMISIVVPAAGLVC